MSLAKKVAAAAIGISLLAGCAKAPEKIKSAIVPVKNVRIIDYPKLNRLFTNLERHGRDSIKWKTEIGGEIKLSINVEIPWGIKGTLTDKINVNDKVPEVFVIPDANPYGCKAHGGYLKLYVFADKRWLKANKLGKGGLWKGKLVALESFVSYPKVKRTLSFEKEVNFKSCKGIVYGMFEYSLYPYEDLDISRLEVWLKAKKYFVLAISGEEKRKRSWWW